MAAVRAVLLLNHGFPNGNARTSASETHAHTWVTLNSRAGAGGPVCLRPHVAEWLGPVGKHSPGSS